MSVVFIQPPFAYAKKSSPGDTARSMPAVSSFGGAAGGGAGGGPAFADPAGGETTFSFGGGDEFEEPHPIAIAQIQNVRMPHPSAARGRIGLRREVRRPRQLRRIA